MSTRSITHIHEDKETHGSDMIVCSFYRHYDGYPSGHGNDLAKWLRDCHITNGWVLGSSKYNTGKWFNGAGELAVDLMYHIKQISGCNVIPTAFDGDMWQDYIYHIYPHENSCTIEIEGVGSWDVNDFDPLEIERIESEKWENE